MMKTNSKIKYIVISLLFIVFIFPGTSYAIMNYGENIRETVKQNLEQRKAEWQARWQQVKNEHKQWQEERENIRETIASKSADRKNQICENLVSQVIRIDQTLTEREAKIEQRQLERAQKIEERRENHDSKLEQHREKWELAWEEHFGKLEEKASTEAQKQALIDFKNEVEEAREVRQIAIDVAISEFRTGLDGLIAERKESVEAAKNAYVSAFNAAVQNAKQACGDGGDPVQIRETLRTALKAAKDEFNSNKQAIEGVDLKSLVDTRQEIFKKAFEDFKNAMEQAKEDLKTAFEI